MGNKTVHEMCLRDLQVNFGGQQSGSPTINMKMKNAQLTISEVQLARTAQPHPVLKGIRGCSNHEEFQGRRRCHVKIVFGDPILHNKGRDR